jgi:hypothetical protein
VLYHPLDLEVRRAVAPHDSDLEIDGPSPEQVNRVVFDACVAALWSDGRMAAAERDRLSALVDRFTSTERERRVLRQRALTAPDRQQLLNDIAALETTARRDLFDRCVQMLRSDARIGRAERRFLRALRRPCGVSLAAYLRATARWSLPGAAALLVVLGLGLLFVWSAVTRTPEPQARTGAVREPRRPVILAAAPADAASLPAEQLYRRVHASVVTVGVLVDGEGVAGGSGSFIGIDEAGAAYVVTNRHVVELDLAPEKSIGYTVEVASGARLGADLDHVSERHDLALLAVPGVARAAVPLGLQPVASLRVGQPVFVVSSPLGLSQSFTSGVISALRGGLIQTDATIHSGSSGGPLLTETGLMCGVVTRSHQAKDISFALPADAVVQMLEERMQSSGSG